ncbi:hypothetical protein [Mesorhizobium sp. M0296]|uniref:hypothetical protein n=1 Tax=Mesorhizobium sp. M0296 TaxID=2956931 RepID=UPI003335211F
MSGLSAVALPFFSLAFVVTLCLSIMIVRRDHPHHVHTLWYIFSLTLCSVSILFLYVYRNATSIQDTILSGMPGKIAVIFMDTSMDVHEELYILATLSSLFIMPQVISYFISGIFGCGSPPVLVSTVSRITTWALIKFFCVLSGILAAQSIFALYGNPYLNPKDSAVKMVEAIFMISVSFFIMGVYYKIATLCEFIAGHPRLKWLESLYRFMTRCRKDAI